MHKKRNKILFYTFSAILILISVIFVVNREKPVRVIVAKVALGEVQASIANTRAGTLNACRRAKLSPSIGGQIAHLPVKEGDQVKMGQILLEIWNQDLLAKVQLAESEAKAASAKSKQACVVADVAAREAKRLTKLHKKNLASDELTERAVGDAMAKRSACQAAQATANVSRAQITVAKAALDRTRLVAPFDGTIAEVNGEIGEVVTPSPVGIAIPPAIDIIDTSCLYIMAPIDEVDAPQVKVGMPAKISLDAYPKKFFDGRVKRVAPYVFDREKQARTVDIEVEFVVLTDNANMIPGYSADVEVVIHSVSNVLRIPTEALLEGNRVLVYQGHKESLVERKIKPGISNWHYTQILSGLALDEQIVTSVDREGVEAGVMAIADTSSSTK